MRSTGVNDDHGAGRIPFSARREVQKGRRPGLPGRLV